VRRLSGRQRRQHGAALILFLTILVLGVAWFAVGALGKAPVATAEREVITGRALQAAKQALLSYAAQYAARSTTADPGQMPCPESLTLANPGEASTSCSATLLVVGRLPWKTLGIDPLRDGAGEPLWYMMRGFRDPPINFGTAGQLTYNGATVVAMIIAPGVPLSTTGTPPAGCTAQNQLVATRNAATLNPANFLECGVATGSIASPGDSAWTNDRVIAITAAEWADAIAPAIADRLQRQVAPVLETWRSTQSNANWGPNFMPYASSFTNPTANDQCGNSVAQGAASEGLLPFARVATSNCSWWQTTGASIANGVAGLIAFSNPTVNCTAIAAGLECTFAATSALNLVDVQFSAIAPNVASSFRAPIAWSNVSFRLASGGAITCAPSGALTQTLSATTGEVSISGACTLSGLLIATPVIMQINHLPDAAIIASLPAWYLSNQWEQHTYYSVAPGWTVNPGTAVCTTADRSGCITINGLDASTGNTDDKRFALVLMGRRLSAQASGTDQVIDYLESRTSATQFAAAATSGAYNDRFAACPSLVTPVCN